MRDRGRQPLPRGEAMKSSRCSAAALLVMVGMAGATAFGQSSSAVAGRAPVAAASVAAVSTQRALLDRYCVPCHNGRLKTGGLTLDTIDLDHIARHADALEKVVRKLRAGMMPPLGRPRPD